MPSTSLVYRDLAGNCFDNTVRVNYSNKTRGITLRYCGKQYQYASSIVRAVAANESLSEGNEGKGRAKDEPICIESDKNYAEYNQYMAEVATTSRNHF